MTNFRLQKVQQVSNESVHYSQQNSKMLVSVLFCWITSISGLRAINLEFNNHSNDTRAIGRYSKWRNLSPKEVKVFDNIRRSLGEIESNSIFVLVHDEAIVENVASYMHSILQMNRENNFRLMIFNATGTSTVHTYNINGEELIDLLKMKPRKTISLINYQGAVFASILKAIELLPRNSGILVFTKEMEIDADLSQWAIKALLDKNIKLITVWQGVYSSLSKNEKLIREATLMSHGNFIIDNTETDLRDKYTEVYSQSGDNNKTMSTIIYKANNYGKREFKFPIDEGATGIRITISDTIGRAYLFTPLGYLIDLLKPTAVQAFSTASFIEKSGKTYMIQLKAAQNTRSLVGIWNLQLDGNAIALEYNLTVSIENNLILTPRIDAVQLAPDSPRSQKALQLILQGEFSRIDNVTISNEFGKPIESNFKYKVLDDADEEVIETLNNRKIKINVTDPPQNPIYLQVNGKDKNGNDFVRLKYYDPEFVRNKLHAITIEVSLNSQLMLAPGESGSIYFEVTNNLNEPLYVDFMCTDVKSMLQWMRPLRAWLTVQQTVTVQLSVIAKSASSNQDLITFTAASRLGRFQKTLMLEVGTERRYDTTNPKLWHTFTSNCAGVLFGDCKDAYWTIEAVTQDTESGILLLTSSPTGLYFPTDYTVGTKHRVTGYYSGSCCDPDIRLTSIDVMRNRKSYVANAYRVLSDGAIAGIAISVIIVIILIIVIIYCLCKKGKCKCKRKQKASVNIATTSYRGPKNSATTTRY